MITMEKFEANTRPKPKLVRRDFDEITTYMTHTFRRYHIVLKF